MLSYSGMLCWNKMWEVLQLRTTLNYYCTLLKVRKQQKVPWFYRVKLAARPRLPLEALRDISCPMQLLETTSFFVWWSFHFQSQQLYHSGFSFCYTSPCLIFLHNKYLLPCTETGELINHQTRCHIFLEAKKPTVRTLVQFCVCQG